MIKQIKENTVFAYEGVMVLLAVCSVATIWYKSGYNDYVIWGTWLVFFIDFVYRLTVSTNKIQFIKHNPFIIIALIPLDAVFQLARTARILHLMRLKVITKYYTKPLINKLKKLRFSYFIPLSMLFIFLAIIPLYVFEPGITSYWDAFIGGVASLVFFGYTSVMPTTLIGKGIIILLTIFGVILHGILISFLLTTILDSQLSKKVKQKLARKKAG
ncbi:hypothetical protein RJD24_00235 [Bacillaceae bacterium IKA-2]|nr:hypothetical protein RJD24_00235 [Bacillaceae bacterium IKA-2]